MKPSTSILLVGLAVTAMTSGCRGIPTPEEKTARQDVSTVGGQLYLTNAPVLSTNATLQDAMLFAARNHPQVAAAYVDWASSVENITVARSLPDPRLTFELYAGDIVSSLMPGIAMDLPGPGKLSARAAQASAESQVKYFQFAQAVQQAAFGVQKAYYPLHFLDARLDVNRQSLALLASLESLARSQNEVGRATLNDVLRAQLEQEQVRTETANLEDSRRLLMAQYKAALGLRTSQMDPPVPVDAQFTDVQSTNDEAMLDLALERNPRLQEMAAEIRAAEAQVRVAHREKVPDFTAGGEVDVKASPFVWNPQLSMTLPIWRDKIAAQIAAAERSKQAAAARLSLEQINLAVDFAEQAYLIREANRTLSLLRERLLPRARQSLQIAQAAYRSGQVDFLNVIEDQRALLNFQLDEIAAQTQREVARAQLSLLIAGSPIPNSPLLPTAHPMH